MHLFLAKIPQTHMKLDFGLARVHTPESAHRPYSHQVATRWYRAPELLYGARKYDEGIDMWGVGCIFGEMLNHYPLFNGSNDIDQLFLVLSRLGTPTKESWPVRSLIQVYYELLMNSCVGHGNAARLQQDNVPGLSRDAV